MTLIKGYNVTKHFYKDLCGTVNGEANKTCQCIMSAEGIANAMGMSISETEIWCDSMIYHGITERQGGMYVV